MSLIKRAAPGRVPLVDEIRGFSIICMVVYHAAYNLVFLFSVDIPIFTSSGMNALRDLFAAIFIFISGSVCNYSKSNLKRGALCFCCGMLLTAATYFFMPQQLILFGILHMLGVCMSLFPLVKKPLYKLGSAAGYILFFSLFFITFNLPRGFLGFNNCLSAKLPEAFYSANLFYFGFASPAFCSADYFPLLPWIFVFFAGAYFGRDLKDGKMPPFFYASHCRPLAAAGRNTLLIYLLHQPLIYGAMSLIAHFCA